MPRWWADASDNYPVDIAGLRAGQHKVKIELVEANHKVFPGQAVTLTFTVPAHDKMSHGELAQYGSIPQPARVWSTGVERAPSFPPTRAKAA
jgi:Family of unknown function (DUF6130)